MIAHLEILQKLRLYIFMSVLIALLIILYLSITCTCNNVTAVQYLHMQQHNNFVIVPGKSRLYLSMDSPLWVASDNRSKMIAY